jgi:hypothetical protein
MTRLRLTIVFASSVSLFISGCDSDTEEVTATASESGGSTSADSGDGTGGSSETSGASGSTGRDSNGATSADATETGAESSGDGSSDTGAIEACADAGNVDSCQGLGGCAWVDTSHVALDAELVCGDLGIEEGHCLPVAGSGACGNFLSTCEDGTPVYYREAGLEVGAVELLVIDDPSLCDVPEGFQPCQVNSEPKPGSEPSYFPEECECACE